MKLNQIRTGEWVKVINPNRVNYGCVGTVATIVNGYIIVTLVDAKINSFHGNRYKPEELQLDFQ